MSSDYDDDSSGYLTRRHRHQERRIDAAIAIAWQPEASRPASAEPPTWRCGCDGMNLDCPECQGSGITFDNPRLEEVMP